MTAAEKARPAVVPVEASVKTEGIRIVQPNALRATGPSVAPVAVPVAIPVTGTVANAAVRHAGGYVVTEGGVYTQAPQQPGAGRIPWAPPRRVARDATCRVTSPAGRRTARGDAPETTQPDAPLLDVRSSARRARRDSLTPAEDASRGDGPLRRCDGRPALFPALYHSDLQTLNGRSLRGARLPGPQGPYRPVGFHGLAGRENPLRDAPLALDGPGSAVTAAAEGSYRPPRRGSQRPSSVGAASPGRAPLFEARRSGGPLAEIGSLQTCPPLYGRGPSRSGRFPRRGRWTSGNGRTRRGGCAALRTRQLCRPCPFQHRAYHCACRRGAFDV